MSADGHVVNVYEKDRNKPLIYSLINEKLDHPLPQQWKSREVLSTILNTTKSSYDGRNNALVSLLIAKAKPYESEKAMYFWMSMNGLYGFLTQEANQHAINSKSRISSETEGQELLCLVTGIDGIKSSLSRDEKNSLRWDAISILKKTELSPAELFDSVKENDQSNPTVTKLTALLERYQLNTGLYTFLSIWLPYQIRCNYFHTDNAVPLFLYADEPLIKALRYTNYFVEQFRTVRQACTTPARSSATASCAALPVAFARLSG